MRLFTIEERRGFPALTRTRRQQRAALLDADDAVDQTSGLRHETRPHMKYKPISTSSRPGASFRAVVAPHGPPARVLTAGHTHTAVWLQAASHRGAVCSEPASDHNHGSCEPQAASVASNVRSFGPRSRAAGLWRVIAAMTRHRARSGSTAKEKTYLSRMQKKVFPCTSGLRGPGNRVFSWPRRGVEPRWAKPSLGLKPGCTPQRWVPAEFHGPDPIAR